MVNFEKYLTCKIVATKPNICIGIKMKMLSNYASISKWTSWVLVMYFWKNLLLMFHLGQFYDWLSREAKERDAPITSAFMYQYNGTVKNGGRRYLVWHFKSMLVLKLSATLIILLLSIIDLSFLLFNMLVSFKWFWFCKAAWILKSTFSLLE